MNSAPFKRGDLVISSLDNLTVKAGDKVRVIDCYQSDKCGSGWLVNATSQIRGPMPKRPTYAMTAIDSDWFTMHREAIRAASPPSDERIREEEPKDVSVKRGLDSMEGERKKTKRKQ